MTSEIEDLLASAGDAVISEYFGETSVLTYRPKDGDAVTIDAVLQGENVARTADADGDFLRHERLAFIATSDVAKPLMNATVVVDSIEYVLSEVGPVVGGRRRVLLVRAASAELNAPGHRGGP